MVSSIADGVSLALPPGLDAAVHESTFCGERVPCSERQRQRRRQQQQQQQQQESQRRRSRASGAHHGGGRTPGVRGRFSGTSRWSSERGSSAGASHRCLLPLLRRAAPTLSHQGPGRRPPTPKRTDAPRRVFYWTATAAGEGAREGARSGAAWAWARKRAPP